MSASAPPRRRRVVVVAAVTAASALLYGMVVALYAADERSRISPVCETSSDEIVLDIAPQSVDAVRDRIGMTVEIEQEGPLARTGLGFIDAVTIVATGTDGDREYTVPPGTIPSTFSMSLLADGRVEQWPFDAHIATTQLVVLQTGDDPRAYVPAVCAQGQVSGWALTAAFVDGADDVVVNGASVPAVQNTAVRSPATVVFGIVILVLMAALPALGLTVAISAYQGRRKVEATLMSWMAAMLFATVPLRTFLPGSPPVGSWVDYLVVLWVVGGLVATLVVYVLAWLRWAPSAGERPAR